MSKLPDNQLDIPLLGVNAMNPWMKNVSSPRMQMFSGHISQGLVINGSTPRRCFTGVEEKYGEFTFSKKFPVNATVSKVISKYPRKIGSDNIATNPLDLVFYEDSQSPKREIGVLSLTSNHVLHQHFGFRYKGTDALSRLSPSATFAKGTVLADSPSIDSQNNYKYGLEAAIAYCSIPGVIEDGIVVSDEFVKRICSVGIESRVESWGKNHYPLNLYGDENNYKPFPDVGERVRSDGLLFALRRYDDLLGPIEMSPSALREPDYMYDRLVYAEPNALVTDITVEHPDNGKYPPTPIGMETQTKKYHKATYDHCMEILSYYHGLRAKRRDSLKISQEFHQLVVNAIAYTHDNSKSRINKAHRRNPLDDWRVEVHFEYDVVPSIGYKLTGNHGNKGVICQIWKSEDMPTDAAGNRAEVIMDAESIIKRMNLGCVYEQYYNATSRDITKRIRNMFGVEHHDYNPVRVSGNATADKTKVNEAFEYLLSYYKVISPKMYELFEQGKYGGNALSHVRSVLEEGVYIWMPPNNPADDLETVKTIRDNFSPTFTPVVYRGRSGNIVETVDPILIGTIYMILLEKTGSDWSGVASARLQHFGIPAKLTKFDKHSTPGRAQPVRLAGETEVRLISAAAGSDTMADIIDQSNNPAVHKEILSNIYRAKYPTNIPEVIDRKKFPVGNGRNLVFVRHIMQCEGSEFRYYPEDTKQ